MAANDISLLCCFSVVDTIPASSLVLLNSGSRFRFGWYYTTSHQLSRWNPTSMLTLYIFQLTIFLVLVYWVNSLFLFQMFSHITQNTLFIFSNAFQQWLNHVKPKSPKSHLPTLSPPPLVPPARSSALRAGASQREAVKGCMAYQNDGEPYMFPQKDTSNGNETIWNHTKPRYDDNCHVKHGWYGCGWPVDDLHKSRMGIRITILVPTAWLCIRIEGAKVVRSAKVWLVVNFS